MLGIMGTWDIQENPNGAKVVHQWIPMELKKIDQSSADLVELEDPKVPRVMVKNIVSQKINILISTTWVRNVGRRNDSAFPFC